MSKWEWKKLGEVAEIVGGSTPKTGVEEYWNGKNIWITPAEIGRDLFLNDSVRHISDAAVKSANLKLMPAGTVILSSRAPIGKLAISNVPFYCNQGFKNAICGDLLNNKFLFFYLLSSTAELESLGKGTTFKEISKTIVENFPVPVPPLSEQKHIVKFLDNEFSKIDTLKTNAETNLKNAKELFESTLEKELSLGKDGALPSGWEWKTLQEISNVYGEYGLSVPSTSYNGIRYLRITDITDDGRLNDEYVSADVEKIEESDKLQEGDILFARTGATVGKTLIFKEDYGCCVFAGYLIRYRPKKEVVLPFYLHYVTHSKSYFDWVKKSQKAAAQPNISAKLYNTFQIPLPPLFVQKEIVARLDKLSENVKRLEANYKQIIANCDELKKTILKQTFQGGN